MSRIALLLSVVSMAAAGWLAWSAGPAPRAPPARTARPDRPRAAPATLAGRPAAPPTLAEIDRRLAALESARTEAEAVMGQTVDPIAPPDFLSPKFYGSVDDAAKDMALSEGQKRDFERISEDAKREVADLRKIPDEEGKTWDDVQKETFKMDGNVFHLDTSKVAAFREKTVPGRVESFGAADRRIRDGAKRRMRDLLTPEQREKFDKAHVDPLTGGNGGGLGDMSFSIVTDMSDFVPEPPVPEGMDGR